MTSKALFRRALKSLAGGVNSPVRSFRSVGGNPIFFKRGKGPCLWDVEGKRYLDLCMSWGPLILGHAHPQVVRTLLRAARSGTSFGACHENEVVLAEIIRSALPSLEKIRFVSSGTEAAMSALRLARAFTRRDKILKFSGGYHGHSDSLLVEAGSGALTFGKPSSEGVPRVVAKNTFVIPYNHPDILEGVFKKMGDALSAVIVEPVAANMGVVVPSLDFLKSLRRLTRKHGALLIFDEVVTGFRSAWGGAQTLFRIAPDLTCLGKIIGGGLPVGAFGGRKEIMRLLAPEGPVYQAGTLSGNPLAVAAGLKTLQMLRRNRPYARLEALTVNLCGNLRRIFGKSGIPVQINHHASLFTIFFTGESVFDLESAKLSGAYRFARFFQTMRKEGIYLPPSQFEACFLSTAHTDSALLLFERAVQKSLGRL